LTEYQNKIKATQGKQERLSADTRDAFMSNREGFFTIFANKTTPVVQIHAIGWQVQQKDSNRSNNAGHTI